MSYTPEPWRLERDYNGVPEFVFGGDTCVCDFGIEAPKPEDARLIAAAPELYEALEAAYMVLKPQKSRFKDYVDAVTLARAALAKARGEEGEEDA